ADNAKNLVKCGFTLCLYRQFRVDDVIDVHRPCGGLPIHLRDGPVDPAWILADDVDQHIAVDKGHFFFCGRSSLYPRVISMISSVVAPRMIRRSATSYSRSL